MLKEMGQTVPKEFDFVREARLQAALQARLALVGRAARVVIPTPRLDLTSRTVLVMQRLHGVSVAAVVRDAVALRVALKPQIEALEAERDASAEGPTLPLDVARRDAVSTDPLVADVVWWTSTRAADWVGAP